MAAHGFRFVVIRRDQAAAHEQGFRFAAEIELRRSGYAVVEHRGGAAIPSQAGSENNDYLMRRYL